MVGSKNNLSSSIDSVKVSVEKGLADAAEKNVRTNRDISSAYQQLKETIEEEKMDTQDAMTEILKLLKNQHLTRSQWGGGVESRAAPQLLQERTGPDHTCLIHQIDNPRSMEESPLSRWTGQNYAEWGSTDFPALRVECRYHKPAQTRWKNVRNTPMDHEGDDWDSIPTEAERKREGT